MEATTRTSFTTSFGGLLEGCGLGATPPAGAAVVPPVAVPPAGPAFEPAPLPLPAGVPEPEGVAPEPEPEPEALPVPPDP